MDLTLNNEGACGVEQVMLLGSFKYGEEALTNGKTLEYKIPKNTMLTRITLAIEDGFNGTSAKIDIGVNGADGKYIANSEVSAPQTVGSVNKLLYDVVNEETTVQVKYSDSGSGSNGKAKVYAFVVRMPE